MHVPKGEMKYRTWIPNHTKWSHEYGYEFVCVFLCVWLLSCAMIARVLMQSIDVQCSKHRYEVFFSLRADVSDKTVPTHTDKAMDALTFLNVFNAPSKWLQICTECIVRCESRRERSLSFMWILIHSLLLHLIVFVHTSRIYMHMLMQQIVITSIWSIHFELCIH